MYNFAKIYIFFYIEKCSCCKMREFLQRAMNISVVRKNFASLLTAALQSPKQTNNSSSASASFLGCLYSPGTKRPGSFDYVVYETVSSVP